MKITENILKQTERKLPEHEAVIASFNLLSPLGNAGAILGFHATQVHDRKLQKRLAKAAKHADKANVLLNKVVYGDSTYTLAK